MLTSQASFSPELRNRLQTTAIGLGLVRLLQDAARPDEARAMLYALEFDFQDVPQESPPASPPAIEAVVPASIRTHTGDKQATPTSIA